LNGLRLHILRIVAGITQEKRNFKLFVDSSEMSQEREEQLIEEYIRILFNPSRTNDIKLIQILELSNFSFRCGDFSTVLAEVNEKNTGYETREIEYSVRFKPID